jgi:AcrR family transcriptional regulator
VKEPTKRNNRERILSAAIELFNLSGAVAVTTNHIAAHLNISPGNLYFHFRNKEEIIRELFDRMCDDIDSIWRQNHDQKNQLKSVSSPEELIEQSFEIFWNYRFFHREMYHLRRKDPALAKKWKVHIDRTVRLLNATYRSWVKAGLMRKINDPSEMRLISDVVLITSSSFFQFYESPEKPATRRSTRQGVEHVLGLLKLYRIKNQ